MLNLLKLQQLYIKYLHHISHVTEYLHGAESFFRANSHTSCNAVQYSLVPLVG
jgi:hypothetical protein